LKRKRKMSAFNMFGMSYVGAIAIVMAAVFIIA
jgi:hypothetical protein